MDVINNMKIKRILTASLVFFVLSTLTFIWGNSMQSIEVSQALSLGVLEKVKPVLEVMAGVGNVTDHFVRKLAHFTEFAALGTQLALLLILFGRVRFQSVVNCAFFGLVVAMLDETIQIFSYRGAQVQDVWLDFAGFCVGLFAGLGIYLFAKAVSHHTRKSSSA